MEMFQFLVFASTGAALCQAGFFSRSRPSLDLTAAERADVMMGRACLADAGDVYALGEEWTSGDETLRFACLADEDTGRAAVSFVGCRLPRSGRSLPIGGVRQNRRSGLTVRCNGESQMLEKLIGRGEGVLCRSASQPETLAERAARNDAVRAANAELIRASTTEADRRAYEAFFADSDWETYQGIQDNAYYRALLQAQPLDWTPRDVCYRMACRRGQCAVFQDGRVSFTDRCSGRDCSEAFQRVLDPQELPPPPPMELKKTV